MRAPFDGISDLQRQKFFKLLGVHIYTYTKNQEILPTIKNEDIICIIIKGKAKILLIDYEGNEELIEYLEENSVFGTSISGTNNENYQIIASETVEVLIIDYNQLLNTENTAYSYYNLFIANMFDIINTKLREKNDRIKILEKKTIRDRLLEFFEIEYRKTHSRNIYLPSSFKDLADYFAVNRAAMFRELRNLKDEKFIDTKGRKIILLNK